MECGEARVPLLDNHDDGRKEIGLARRSWEESKKLWMIVGPAMINRVSLYGMGVVTIAYAGHLGDLDLAATSIAVTVIMGFNFGLMLGMASALETLCGQAYGAKKYNLLGVYLQRSWMLLFLCAVLLLPTYLFVTPVLEWTGEPPELARRAGEVSRWLIPVHFSFVLLFPLQRFLQCQLKNNVIAVVTTAAFVAHVLITWLLVHKFQLGLAGAVIAFNLSWWLTVVGELVYAVGGGCPLSWQGFSAEALSGLWDFFKLSAASGVMLCLENWYYRILILLAGSLQNAKIEVDALSICMNINGWEMMVPLAFFVGAGVRVANELGAGNGKGARFATIVAVVTSSMIGLVFWSLIIVLHDKFALIFTSSTPVLYAVDRLSVLLAFTVLLNSIQPVLSGVAVGSGWQAMVAYINIGSYYLIGVPVGILLGWVFHLGILGIWAGLIGGTIIQTLVLAFLTMICDWDKEAKIANARIEKLAGVASN